MGSDQTQLLVLDPLLKSDHVFCHFPDFFNASAAFDIEGVKDFLSLCADRVFVGNVVGDDPHLFPVELLGIKSHLSVKVGLVDIKIHHAWIRSSDLGDVGIAESSSGLCCTAPVFDLSLNDGIAAFYDACDAGMSLAESFKVSYHFADSTACIAFAQPYRDIGVIVIEGFQFLHIDKNDRNVQILDGRKHVVGGCIGKKLKEHQINVCRAEFVAGCLGLFFGGDHAAVDDLDGIRNGLFEGFILCLEFRHKLRELGKIGSQGDGKDADSCFGLN